MATSDMQFKLVRTYNDSITIPIVPVGLNYLRTGKADSIKGPGQQKLPDSSTRFSEIGKLT